ncbi:MAG: radical SAM protein [Nitrospirae bacterium]|nr:radical SAM protein [Magnetococcales bacterium]
MKIYFLNPPFHPHFSRSERSPQVAKSRTLYYPVWLAQAAAIVEQAGAEIALLDAIADGRSLADCLTWIRDGAPDLVVIETTTASMGRDMESVRTMRAAFPDLQILFVGSHVSALPEETLRQCPELDGVVRGEYETPLVELVAARFQGQGMENVRGLSFRQRKGTAETIRHNPDAELLRDLDDIPAVAPIYKRFLHHRNYFFSPAHFPGVMLMTGRGCPHRCAWCVFNQTLHGRRYRFHSTQRILEEFEYIIAHFPDVKEVWIDDDTFTVHRAHVLEICQGIIDRKLRFQNHPFRWYCNARPPLDGETMLRMRQAGCRLMVTGFESGSPEILKQINKGFTVEAAETFMANARRAGLLVHGCFVVGNPGETPQSMEQTLAFAKRLLPDSAQFYFVHPYPGTDYYRWAQENHLLTETDFDRWLDPQGQHRCVITLPQVTADQLTAFCNRAYKEYHFSGPYLRMKLKQLITQPSEGFRSLHSAFHFLRDSWLRRPHASHP